MKDVAKDELCRIISSYGEDVCSDHKRIEGLLRDFCGEHKREINLILCAMKARVVSDLLSSLASVPHHVVIARLSRRLEEEHCLTPDSARWAVEAWACALGRMVKPDAEEKPEKGKQERSRQGTRQKNTNRKKASGKIAHGQILTGMVIQVSPDGIIVDLGSGNMGMIPSHEIGHVYAHGMSDISVGDEITAMAIGTSKNEVILSQKQSNNREHSMSELSVPISIPFLAGSRHFEYEFTLKDFRTVCGPILERAVKPIKQAMEKAGLKKGDIKLVLLAGGNSQLPGIRDMVREQVGIEPKAFPGNVRLAVAYGAALYHKRIFELPALEQPKRILGDNLGLCTFRGGEVYVQSLLDCTTPLPASFERIFPLHEGQDAISIKLCLSDGDAPGQYRALRARVLKLRNPIKSGSVMVRINIDENRIIRLEAFDLGDPSHRIDFEEKASLYSDKEIARIKKKYGLDTMAGRSKATEYDENRHPCIGIALGTTTSELAYVNRTGKPQPRCLENRDASDSYLKESYPSVVYFPGGGQKAEVANRKALEALQRCEPNVFDGFKIRMGSVDDSHPAIVEGRRITPEIFSAHLLTKIWSHAQESFLSDRTLLKTAVITVPAAFGPDQCADTINAAMLAGIEPVTLIDEPTATFLYYKHLFTNIADGDIQYALIFDFDEGTADVTILDVSNDPVVGSGKDKHKLFDVLAIEGDIHCGGRRIDERIAEFFQEKFEKQNNMTLDGKGFALLRLKQAAEKAKVELSELVYREEYS